MPDGLMSCQFQMAVTCAGVRGPKDVLLGFRREGRTLFALRTLFFLMPNGVLAQRRQFSAALGFTASLMPLRFMLSPAVS